MSTLYHIQISSHLKKNSLHFIRSLRVCRKSNIIADIRTITSCQSLHLCLHGKFLFLCSCLPQSYILSLCNHGSGGSQCKHREWVFISFSATNLASALAASLEQMGTRRQGCSALLISFYIECWLASCRCSLYQLVQHVN